MMKQKKVYTIIKDCNWLQEMFRIQDYHSIYNVHGEYVLLQHLEELEEAEEYLKCADLIHFINCYNKNNNTNIPTRFIYD